MRSTPNLGNLLFRIPLVMLAIIFVAETAIMTVFALVVRSTPIAGWK
jgi:hypothetical protein